MEAANDVVSGVGVEQVSINVPVKFDDSVLEIFTNERQRWPMDPVIIGL